MADDAPRKPGRPPRRQNGATVATWLPTPEYDRLFQLAKRRDESLSACLRRLIAPKLKS